MATNEKTINSTISTVFAQQSDFGPPLFVEFSGPDGAMLLRIHTDGRVDVGDGLTPDEAGRGALDAIVRTWPRLVEQAREEGRKSGLAEREKKKGR